MVDHHSNGLILTRADRLCGGPPQEWALKWAVGPTREDFYLVLRPGGVSLFIHPPLHFSARHLAFTLSLTHLLKL